MDSVIDGTFFLGLPINENCPHVFNACNLITGESLVAKKEEKSSSNQDTLQREFNILKSILPHPQIVKPVAYISDQKSNYLMTYQSGTLNIATYLNKFGALDEPEAFNIFHLLCQGINHLHCCGVIHGDLKPENVILTREMTPVICDFGGSLQYIEGQKLKSMCVSIPYSAPEVKQDASDHGSQNIKKKDSQKEWERAKSRDVWGLGMVLYCMVTGSVPWTKDQWMIGDFKLSLDPESGRSLILTHSLKNLLRRMLEKKIKNRITIPEIWQTDWMLKFEKTKKPLVSVSRSESSPTVRVTRTFSKDSGFKFKNNFLNIGENRKSSLETAARRTSSSSTKNGNNLTFSYESKSSKNTFKSILNRNKNQDLIEEEDINTEGDREGDKGNRGGVGGMTSKFFKPLTRTSYENPNPNPSPLSPSSSSTLSSPSSLSSFTSPHSITSSTSPKSSPSSPLSPKLTTNFFTPEIQRRRTSFNLN